MNEVNNQQKEMQEQSSSRRVWLKNVSAVAAASVPVAALSVAGWKALTRDISLIVDEQAQREEAFRILEEKLGRPLDPETKQKALADMERLEDITPSDIHEPVNFLQKEVWLLIAMQMKKLDGFNSIEQQHKSAARTDSFASESSKRFVHCWTMEKTEPEQSVADARHQLVKVYGSLSQGLKDATLAVENIGEQTDDTRQIALKHRCRYEALSALVAGQMTRYDEVLRGGLQHRQHELDMQSTF